MWSVEPLKSYTNGLIENLGEYGYCSSVVYHLESVLAETGELSFKLTPKKQELPLRHRWPLGGMEAAFFKKQVDRGLVLGLYMDEELAGFAACESVAWNRTLYINSLFIAERFRGHGGGRLLLEAIEKRAKSLSLSFVTLEAQGRNGSAVDFYRHCGYAVVGFDGGKYTGAALEAGEIAIFLNKPV